MGGAGHAMLWIAVNAATAWIRRNLADPTGSSNAAFIDGALKRLLLHPVEMSDLHPLLHKLRRQVISSLR